jgi:6-phosphofructokinase 2
MTGILTVTLNPSLDVSGETETIRATRKCRTANERYDPGGGGINVARVVRTLGSEAEALFLAGGETGDLLDRLLAQHGIKRHRIAVSGMTRIGFTVKETGTGLEYRFVAEGPAIASEAIERCLEAVGAHEGRYVVASGSLPPEAPPDLYARMAELTARRGAKFVLDTSGKALGATLERAKVHLIKPSMGEMEQLAGRKLDIDDAIREASGLVTRGVSEIVAVTLGADGAIIADADGAEFMPAIPVRVRSAVGAGDSFVAAMTLALSEGQPVREAFRFGIAAGAAAAMTPGTELCRREDVTRLRRRMQRQMVEEV